MGTNSTFDMRWMQIQETRPRTANGEARPGSTGIAYLMWQTGLVERIRVMSQNRFGLIRYQRLTSGAMGEIDIKFVRSENEIVDFVKAKLPDYWPKDIRKWDPTRLPRAIQKQTWEGTD